MYYLSQFTKFRNLQSNDKRSVQETHQLHLIYPIQNRPLHKQLVNNPIPLPTTPIIRTGSNPRSLALSAATVRADAAAPASLSLSL